jgi:alanine racemase
MGRLGVRAEDAAEMCNALAVCKNIRVDGLMTHLAAADDASKAKFTNEQLDRFDRAIAAFRERGFRPTYIHAANSAATFAKSRSEDNLVRPGGSLYGFTRDVFPKNIETPPLKPVMSLHSRIMLLKHVPRGEMLGYGCTFETQRDSLIATLPIGYDDGYSRGLSNRGRVIVRGQVAPVVGRVSMDLTLIDVTDVPDVSTNDHVTLLGREGESMIAAEDLAELAGTISYEVTCRISNRVPRIYRN